MQLIDGVESILRRLSLITEVGHVELALSRRTFLQCPLDFGGLTILFPVVNFNLFFHHIVLFCIPHECVSRLYSKNNSQKQAAVGCH